MKNKIHSLIVEGVLFCGSGLGLLSYSLISYGKAFNKSWAQSPYLFPLIVGAVMTGLSLWLIGEGILAAKRDSQSRDNVKMQLSGENLSRVVLTLILCGGYYLALANLKIPYITIGI